MSDCLSFLLSDSNGVTCSWLDCNRFLQLLDVLDSKLTLDALTSPQVWASSVFLLPLCFWMFSLFFFFFPREPFWLRMITVECLNNLWMLLQREALAPELASAKREIELLRIEVYMIMMVNAWDGVVCSVALWWCHCVRDFFDLHVQLWWNMKYNVAMLACAGGQLPAGGRGMPKELEYKFRGQWKACQVSWLLTQGAAALRCTPERTWKVRKYTVVLFTR